MENAEKRTSPIGIIDSGVGGLTVAGRLTCDLPHEDVIYVGDSKNCPYGNKSADEIFSLSLKMLEFLQKQGVKCVAVACNTISALADDLQRRFDFPIISIVDCAADGVARKNPEAVGFIATEFTVKSGVYERLISARLPECRVVSAASEKLAALIDGGSVGGSEVEAEIKKCVGGILEKEHIKSLILGCTHYPIVAESFKKCFPDIELIDPAVYQCEKIEKFLAENGLLNDLGGNFTLYTTGKTAAYSAVLRHLGAKAPEKAVHTSL